VPIWIHLLLVGGVFVLDLLLPPDVPAGTFYASVTLLALWSNNRRAWLIAAVSTICVAVGVLASTGWSVLGWVVSSVGHVPPRFAWLNAGTTIASLWLIAFGVRRYGVGMDERGEAIRRAQDLERALDSSAIVAATDVRGDINYVNDTFCQISKYSREELIGRNHRILNSGFHSPEFFKDLWKTIANGKVWRGELRNRAKDGSIYWVDTTIVPFLDDRGKPHRYVSIRYDITDRKAQELRLRDQAALVQLGRMAAVVAHEVRNPLAGIRGALQVIESRMDPAARERAVAREIVQRIDTLNSIVEDLLTFARPRPPVLGPVDLQQLSSALDALSQNDPAFARVKVDTDRMNGIVTADAELMKLVLVNLITNSAQAMKGEGRVTLTASRDGAWRTIQVADEGPGIPPDVMAHLFEPFFTTKSRGTGLGLATVRRLIEAQGGSVTITCPPGGGTTAAIRLPAV
jgi:two-component system CheB/CheR fusion protein